MMTQLVEQSPCMLVKDLSKQGETAPLPNTRHWMRVSRVLEDDHYKRMPRVTVDVAR